MGDYTYFTFQVHHVPDDQLDAFAAAVAEAFEVEHWNGVNTSRYDPPSDQWTEDTHAKWIVRKRTLAEAIREDTNPRFNEEEVQLCQVSDTDFSTIVAAAPDAVWETWTDPKYEWLGDWVGYSPATGIIRGDCSESGYQVVNYHQAESALVAEIHHSAQPTILAILFPQHAFHAEVAKLQHPPGADS